ncbi:MAG: PIG-L family deacetylase [Candidatus Omnitrophica bacterium]|nr:PIG-L family deacetylase [Candidatus Omnitrophota bacterium]MBU4488906.1 PIG-L family deacetylase [Candidatus Omnitrophota bacterium]
MKKNENRILVIAAHPDDEILGCGGTVARLINEGHEAYALILGEGITSRYAKGSNRMEKDLKALRSSIERANRVIGVKKVYPLNFPDNRFDAVPTLDIVKNIEAVKNRVKPQIIFTHHWRDLNIDHRITFNAVLTACRPVEEETVSEIYSFEIPSSTEWNYPYTFAPNLFVDITMTMKKKLAAVKCYTTELRKFPHPRSPRAIETQAAKWGSVASRKYAEAFEAVRIIR